MTTGCAISINSMRLEGKIPDGDPRWGHFNESFSNQCLDPIEFANQVYLGHAYTSWHSPEYRKSDNWVQSQFIAVDMDTQDRRSRISTLADHDFVMTYGTLIHTTPSHKEDAPRCRVVFFLDRPITNPIAYGNACKFLSGVFGGDEASTDPSRFFYGNANADIELIGNFMSVDHLYTLYQRANRREQRATAHDAHRREQYSNQRHYSGNEDKQQTIAKALEHIDPWRLEYKEWVSIIAAIKYEIGEDGFAMAERWANGKKGEVQKMWRSFRREGGNVARIPTIVHFAQLHRGA